ncbi:hypothetical protein LMG7143_04454 [Ralstonia thomasii]|uniref:hypothetical protein n=1 Tax=Ralstonia thomasii TaxID=3058596 RepID=UPI0028F57988|nr:hypothetical protein [Ralstonia sp. LMG 18095]CAJ0718579.1 hypothetical protein LMG7143_04454 [Ralstonia sp. LMG 18095]
MHAMLKRAAFFLAVSGVPGTLLAQAIPDPFGLITQHAEVAIQQRADSYVAMFGPVVIGSACREDYSMSRSNSTHEVVMCWKGKWQELDDPFVARVKRAWNEFSVKLERNVDAGLCASGLPAC